jgi:hypothetical protein
MQHKEKDCDTNKSQGMPAPQTVVQYKWSRMLIVVCMRGDSSTTSALSLSREGGWAWSHKLAILRMPTCMKPCYMHSINHVTLVAEGHCRTANLLLPPLITTNVQPDHDLQGNTISSSSQAREGRGQCL